MTPIKRLPYYVVGTSRLIQKCERTAFVTGRFQLGSEAGILEVLNACNHRPLLELLLCSSPGVVLVHILPGYQTAAEPEVSSPSLIAAPGDNLGGFHPTV